MRVFCFKKGDENMKQSKLRYAILKELDKGNKPTEEMFGLDFGEYMLTLNDLQNEGYIKRAYLSKVDADLSDAIVTEKGEEYLLKNSGLAKAYTVAKELKDWIKL